MDRAISSLVFVPGRTLMSNQKIFLRCWLSVDPLTNHCSWGSVWHHVGLVFLPLVGKKPCWIRTLRAASYAGRGCQISPHCLALHCQVGYTCRIQSARYLGSCLPFVLGLAL
jgi:hypothetical protein